MKNFKSFEEFILNEASKDDIDTRWSALLVYLKGEIENYRILKDWKLVDVEDATGGLFKGEESLLATFVDDESDPEVQWYICIDAAGKMWAWNEEDKKGFTAMCGIVKKIKGNELDDAILKALYREYEVLVNDFLSGKRKNWKKA